MSIIKKKLFLEGPLVSSLTGTSALIRPVEVATTSCDARNCILDRFKGRKADWVQCDSCDKWIHQFCAGLTKKEVEVMKEYYCESCC